MHLMFAIQHLRHLKYMNYFYEYDLPIQIQSYKSNLLAIISDSTTKHEMLHDYTELISDSIKNNERPALIIKKLSGLIYVPISNPTVIKHDCRELTIKQVQSIINANIAAISNLNRYFNDYVLISQINSTV